MQSLLNRRLVVQVGERIDTYWDTFRDFLLTGRVAIEESYIIRYAPPGPAKLVCAVLAGGGDMTVPALASQLGTSNTVVFNFARELRQFGVLTSEPNRVVVEPSVLREDDREAAIRSRVAHALRDHKIHSLVTRLLAEGGSVSLTHLAETMPTAFPAVEAKFESWMTYARAFSQWLDYAGLVKVTRNGIERAPEQPSASTVRLLTTPLPVRVRGAFPAGAAGPAMKLLLHLADPTRERPPQRQLDVAVRDLSAIGAIVLDERERWTLADAQLVVNGTIDPTLLRLLLLQQPGIEEAFNTLHADPGAPPYALGNILRSAHGAEWADAMTKSVGKYIRSWARACSIMTWLRSSADVDSAQESLTLFQHLGGDARS